MCERAECLNNCIPDATSALNGGCPRMVPLQCVVSADTGGSAVLSPCQPPFFPPVEHRHWSNVDQVGCLYLLQLTTVSCLPSRYNGMRRSCTHLIPWLSQVALTSILQTWFIRPLPLYPSCALFNKDASDCLRLFSPCAHQLDFSRHHLSGVRGAVTAETPRTSCCGALVRGNRRFTLSTTKRRAAHVSVGNVPTSDTGAIFSRCRYLPGNELPSTSGLGGRWRAHRRKPLRQEAQVVVYGNDPIAHFTRYGCVKSW